MHEDLGSKELPGRDRPQLNGLRTGSLKPDCVQIVTVAPSHNDTVSVGDVWHFHAEEIEENEVVDFMRQLQPPSDCHPDSESLSQSVNRQAVAGLAGFANVHGKRRLIWQIAKDANEDREFDIIWVFEHVGKGSEIFEWQKQAVAAPIDKHTERKNIDPRSHRFFHGMTFQPCKTHLLCGCGLNPAASQVLGGEEHYLVYAVAVDKDLVMEIDTLDNHSGRLRNFAESWLLAPVWSTDMYERVLISTSSTLHYSHSKSKKTKASPHLQVYGIGRHGHNGKVPKMGVLKQLLEAICPKLGKFELSLKTHGFSSAVINTHLETGNICIAPGSDKDIVMRQPAALKPMVYAHRCYRAFRRNNPDLLPELNFWENEKEGSLIAYNLRECAHENFFEYRCPRLWLEANKRQPKWIVLSFEQKHSTYAGKEEEMEGGAMRSDSLLNGDGSDQYHHAPKGPYGAWYSQSGEHLSNYSSRGHWQRESHAKASAHQNSPCRLSSTFHLQGMSVLDSSRKLDSHMASASRDHGLKKVLGGPRRGLYTGSSMASTTMERSGSMSPLVSQSQNDRVRNLTVSRLTKSASLPVLSLAPQIRPHPGA
mmetsp:Transcript_71899/g.127030  ORF Transcript_71899/g.127030 Transcript_71899/m.127030 type:complete len:593 (-) Transcript_71899:460-2238(-)|eukprot:CAMPEP_0197627530 /NCGR_PEP_ID=MMETSP1338-20131121/6122_1 /TAXON_ID=43686 ORGANISM="Pelagodinium beii, Strain RCC1491" /NCGR_SAMPLE_ID=MMETSP1338 /ASSEMBLY_ACC=CAM_ASM_000754 /LENGTH=592 /DNA_ID=CAMNT_0043198275 /DNA_START=159 /DNA_END=1937 /DNA_ORIENTATION=+